MNSAIIDNEPKTMIGAGEQWFEAKDVAAFIMAAVMTLGPLAAVALFP